MSNLLALNGKPSNLTAEQYNLVRTKAFKDWFGDWENDPENASKVVDENGEPLVCYHFTPTKFYSFDKSLLGKETKRGDIGIHASSLLGFWFNTNKSFFEEVKNEFNVIEVFLNVKDLSKINNLNHLWMNLQRIVEDTAETYNTNDFGENDVEYKSSNEVAEIFLETYITYEDGILISKDTEFGGSSYIVFYPEDIKLADGTNTTFDADNPDIRFNDGGEVEDLINEGIVELKMYETTPEHAREYGISSINPLYIQTICVNNDSRLKGIGKKVLAYIDEYAMNNGNDIVFGHITQKAEFTKDERQNFFCDVDLIKNWLYSNGYAINDDNNDFHKVIQKNVRYNNGGQMKKVDKGGITYGKSHDEGGIPVKNASTGQMLEVEGGEGIVNKRSMASDKKVKMNGKEMTICEAVSQLNQMEGGVKFSCDDVKHRQFIEEMELGGELERGIRTEKEHIETLKKLYENRITPNEAVKEVAKEHIAENPNYYSDLQKMEKAKNEYSPMLLQSVEKDLMTYNVPLHLISPIESRDFEYDEPFVRFASGGIPKVKCGCDHKVQKYMNGGIFGGGLDELSYFKEPSQEDKMAEKCVRIIEKARKILNQDLKSKLMTKKLDESLVKYFAPYQKINLYDEGWRFAYGQSKQWAGLCAFKGLEQDRNKKTLYLSVDFVKKDEVFENHFEEVVYHEMAHALVDEYILTKIGKVSMKEIDLLHFIDTKEQPYGHGKIWANICKCLDSNCDVFYRKAQFSSNWKEFKYECSNCGETRYGDTKNFTQICYKCFKAVYVTKNNE